MSSILRALRTLPVYVVTGKTEYNTFGANACVPAKDTGTPNDALNAGGAIGVTQITDVTGLVAWKDYVPVQQEEGRTVPFSYDANGYFPIKKVSGAIFGVASTVLIHFDATPIVDSSGNAYAITQGTANLDNNGKFSKGLNAATSAVTKVNANAAFRNSVFTFDCWFKPTNMTDLGTFPIVWLGQRGMRLGFDSSNDRYMVLTFDSALNNDWYTSAVNSALLNTWAHLACVRDGADTRFYLDGVLQTNQVSNTNDASTYVENWDIQLAPGSAPGILDEVRFVSGQALYTSNFTPPAAPYTT